MKTDLNCLSETYKSVKDILKRYCHVRTDITAVAGYGEDFTKYYSHTVYSRPARQAVLRQAQRQAPLPHRRQALPR